MCEDAHGINLRFLLRWFPLLQIRRTRSGSKATWHTPLSRYGRSAGSARMMNGQRAGGIAGMFHFMPKDHRSSD
jgi:hypothetical protein